MLIEEKDKEQKLLIVSKKRKEIEEKWDPNLIPKLKSEKKTIVLICPWCQKPNMFGSAACTSCNFELCQYDVQLSGNVFLDIVNGIHVEGTNILLRRDRAIVVDDKYSISQMHIDVIPVQMIKDISFLRQEHIPLLEELYNSGLEALQKKR